MFEAEQGRKAVLGTASGRSERLETEEMLVATGRTPVVDGLGLEEAGVEVRTRGIVIDERRRTASSPSMPPGMSRAAGC